MDSVTADLARQLSSAYPAERTRTAPSNGDGAHGNGAQGNGAREQWSLGDLLKRASEPEPPPIPPAAPATHHMPNLEGSESRRRPAELRLEDLAGAIDERTAANFWQRYRRGDPDALSPEMYAPHGRETFEDIARRCQHEPDFKATVERYMADFERLLQESQTRHRDGRGVRHYLLSESGRVYLLLAHASGRLNRPGQG